MEHRNNCYGHRKDEIDVIEMGKWADALTEYIRFDYEIYIVKGNANILDAYKKKIKRFRDTLIKNPYVTYFFQGVDYEDTQDLIEAFANNWNDAMMCIKAENDLQEFMRKQTDLIYSKFKETSAPFMYIENKRNQLTIDQIYKNENINDIKSTNKFTLLNQICMFRFIYTMNPDLNKIYWNSIGYNRSEFVDLFLMPIVQKTKKVNAKKVVENSILYIFSKFSLFSFYINSIRYGDKVALAAAINCESSIRNFVEGNLEDENLSQFYNSIYRLASYISEMSSFVFMHEKDHYAPHKCDEVTDVMVQIDKYLDGEEDFSKLYKIITQILTPSLRGWLKHKNNELIDDYFNRYMHLKSNRFIQEKPASLLDLISNYSNSKSLLNEDEFRLWVVSGFFEVLIGNKSEDVMVDISIEYDNIRNLFQKQKHKTIDRYHLLNESIDRYKKMNKELGTLYSNNKITSFYEAADYFDNYMSGAVSLSEQICAIESYMQLSNKFIRSNINKHKGFSIKNFFSDPLLSKMDKIVTHQKQRFDNWERVYCDKINSNRDEYICYRYKDEFSENISYNKNLLSKKHEEISDIQKDKTKIYIFIGVALVLLIQFIIWIY